MASILSLAGGASDGLETVLERMLRQQQIDQQRKQQEGALAETTRHNTAAEGIQRDQLSSVERDRKEREAETARAHRGAEDARDDTNVTRQIALRPIGSFATPEEHTRETAHGAPSGLYQDYQPPNMGRSTETEEIGPTPGGFKWNGTEDQQIRLKAAEKETGVNSQQKTVLYKGKPVDADFNPRTNKTTYRGADITNEAEHYEKPPGPDRVLIQTDDGYMRRPDAAKKLAGGGDVPLATPATVRQRKNMADRVKEHVPETMTMLEEADKKGLLGPVLGRWSDFLANKVGSTGNAETDDLMGQLAFNLSGLRTGFANVHGGARGGGSIQMANMWKEIFNSKQMSKERLMGALKQEQKWLDTYGTQSKEGAGGPADLVFDPATGTFKKPGN